jgi:hypothetical protein
MKSKPLYTLKSGETLARYRDLEYYGRAVTLRGETSMLRLTVGKQERLVVDGKPGKVYDTVSMMGFTPDLKVVYVGKSGKKETLVVPSGPLPEVDKIVEYTFSKTGKLAFVAKKGRSVVVVVDGKETEPYAFVTNIVFDDKGELEYYANKGGTPDKHIQDRRPTTTGTWFFVKKGAAEETTYEDVGSKTANGKWDYGELCYPTTRTLKSPPPGKGVDVVKEGKKERFSLDGKPVGDAFDAVFPSFDGSAKVGLAKSGSEILIVTLAG